MDKQEQYLNMVLKNLKGETVIDVRVDIDNERVIHFKYPFQDEIKVRNINGILSPHISKVWGDDRPDIKYLYKYFLFTHAYLCIYVEGGGGPIEIMGWSV